MKKLFLFLLIMQAAFFSKGQAVVKISQLTAKTGFCDSCWVPVVDGSTNKKMQGYQLAQKKYFALPFYLDGDTVKINPASGSDDGYLTAADYAAFSAGSSPWTTSGANIYNSNAGSVGIGAAPAGTAKLEITGKISSTDEGSIQGITLRHKLNAIAIGPNTMAQSAIPQASLFVGGFAGADVTGINNTALGYAAMYNATGPAGSVAVGWNAMRYRTAGFYNTAVGYEAMGLGVGTGGNNNAFGRAALKSLTSGTDNTAIGHQAGISLIDGSGNIFIGSGAGGSATNISSELNIGNWIKGTAGQISIGGSLPNAAAILDIQSTTKALVIPRMTKAERDAIVSPIAGSYIYQTDNTPGLREFNGTNWMKFTTTTD